MSASETGSASESTPLLPDEYEGLIERVRETANAMIPRNATVLVVSRDLFIIGGMLLAYVLASPMPVKPLWISKVNTVAQIVLVAFTLGERSGVGTLQPIIVVTVLAVAFLTIASAGAYLVEWVRHMAGGPGHVSGGDA